MKGFVASAFAFIFVLASSNYAAADCGSYLQAGHSYSNKHTNHQGKSFDGRMTINHTYNCAEGTCFLGTIMFPQFNGGMSETIAGYWQGTNFKMRRYVDLYSYVQTWTGSCGRGISGNWVIDPEASCNYGTFSIW